MHTSRPHISLLNTTACTWNHSTLHNYQPQSPGLPQIQHPLLMLPRSKLTYTDSLTLLNTSPHFAHAHGILGQAPTLDLLHLHTFIHGDHYQAQPHNVCGIPLVIIVTY